MKTRTKISILTAAVLLLSLVMVGTALADGSYLNIPLNNDTAEQGTDCPTSGGPYWHFVISPNNGESYFITFHLNLGEAATYDTSIFVPNGSQLDNVFVAVPGGKTITSLSKTGSSADIYWSGVGVQPVKFQLSHVCAGTAKDLTVSKTAQPSFTRTFDWDISKVVDPPVVYSAGGGESEAALFTIAVTKNAGTDSDWAVSGTITVHNPNSFAVSGVSLSDSTPGGSCVVTPASVDVPASGEASADYVCTFSSNPGSGTNTVTATWPEIGSPNTSASGTADYVFGDPTKLVYAEIDVVDTNGKSWHFTDSGSVSYSMTYTDPAGTCTSHENTATITQLGKSASASVTDCQGADLTVTKTAVPSYDLTYAWNITKSVDPASAKVDPGQPAIFNYTVSVSHDAGTESNWQVNGVITVSNPNDWQDIIANVSDEMLGCVNIMIFDPVTVPAGGSVEVPYSCTFGSNPGFVVNTAKVQWDQAAYHTLNGSASISVPVVFSAPTNVYDECVNVTDSVAGNLGTACVGDPNPKTFTYTETYYGPAGGTCMQYPNTATFTTNDTGTTGSASAEVTICSWMGRLTPGYWKNHLVFDPKNPLNPWVAKYLPQILGNFNVTSTSIVTSIFNAMNCGTSKDQDAIGCLAGHLLAAKLNVANGANTCISSVISSADTFLKAIPYIGPTGKYTLTSAQRSSAISLKSSLDQYNNNGYCH